MSETILYWCFQGCWGEEFHPPGLLTLSCKHCNEPLIVKRGQVAEFTVTFRIYPDDLGYIARMPTNEDGSLDSEALMEFFIGLTNGDVNRPVPDWIERYENDPDYSIFAEFCGHVAHLRKTIPVMQLIAHSAS